MLTLGPSEVKQTHLVPKLLLSSLYTSVSRHGFLNIGQVVNTNGIKVYDIGRFRGTCPKTR